MGLSLPSESGEYRAARDRLLLQEIDLRRAMEAVAVSRRALPPSGRVPEDYLFQALDANGRPIQVRLSELFSPGHDTLIAYSFMFPRHPNDPRPGPSRGATAALPRDEGPCASCTAFLDSMDRAVRHVEAAGSDFVVIAMASPERLRNFARERGWRNLRLLSSSGNTFKRDYHAESPDGSQLPMMTVFHRSNGEIRHSWSSEMMDAPADPGQDPRHNGTIDLIWNIMDLTPEGRPANWREQFEYDSEAAHAAEENVCVARAAYEAYVTKDRAALEALIAEDFHFTSPLDNRIDRKTYFERCWPNSERTEGFDFIHLVPDGDRVFVTYDGRAAGKRFRNTEIMTLRSGRIVDVEVYFGWSIPHPAKPGRFVDEERS
jgi:predicted dithiol-disulfide oxidoreductase (DUF899 family)/ketosteroid isomerase-like protein